MSTDITKGDAQVSQKRMLPQIFIVRRTLSGVCQEIFFHSEWLISNQGVYRDVVMWGALGKTSWLTVSFICSSVIVYWRWMAAQGKSFVMQALCKRESKSCTVWGDKKATPSVTTLVQIGYDHPLLQTHTLWVVFIHFVVHRAWDIIIFCPCL